MQVCSLNVVATLLVTTAVALPCSAQVFTPRWTGGGSDNLWTNPDNWDFGDDPGTYPNDLLNPPFSSQTLATIDATGDDPYTIQLDAALLPTLGLDLGQLALLSPDATLRVSRGTVLKIDFLPIAAGRFESEGDVELTVAAFANGGDIFVSEGTLRIPRRVNLNTGFAAITGGGTMRVGPGGALQLGAAGDFSAFEDIAGQRVLLDHGVFQANTVWGDFGLYGAAASLNYERNLGGSLVQIIDEFRVVDANAESRLNTAIVGTGRIEGSSTSPFASFRVANEGGSLMPGDTSFVDAGAAIGELAIQGGLLHNGSLVIDADFTNADIESDTLPVTGALTLGESSSVAFRFNGTPVLNDRFEFLSYGSRGNSDPFSAVTANLPVDGNLAIQLDLGSPTGAGSVAAEFVTTQAITFVGTATQSGWSLPANWNTGVAPTNRDIVTVDRTLATPGNQRLVVSANTQSHQVTLSGQDADNRLELVIGDGTAGNNPTFAVTTQLTAGPHSTVALRTAPVLSPNPPQSRVVANTIVIDADAEVNGEGVLKADRVLLNGTLSPGTPGLGFSDDDRYAQIVIDGALVQTATSTIEIDVRGQDFDDYDRLFITDDALFGGTIKLNIDPAAVLDPTADPIEIARVAGNVDLSQLVIETPDLGPLFFRVSVDEIDVSTPVVVPGVDDQVFEKLLAVNFSVGLRGDITRDGQIDAEDVRGFALALMDEQAFFKEFSDDAVNAADFDNNGAADFDDLDDFLEATNGVSPRVLFAEMNRLSRVPEPSAVWLLASAALPLVLRPVRQRRRPLSLLVRTRVVRPAAVLGTIVLSTAAVAQDAPARFWFSLSPNDPFAFGRDVTPGNVAIATLRARPGEQRKAYLWARPQSVDGPLRMFGISLDVLASDTQGTTLDGFVFANPAAAEGDTRFSSVADSSSSTPKLPDEEGHLKDLRALGQLNFVDDRVTLGGGIGPRCVAGQGGCVDGLGGPAWLVGVLSVTAGANLDEYGAVDSFHLQTGEGRIVHSEDGVALPSWNGTVRYGADSDQPAYRVSLDPIPLSNGLVSIPGVPTDIAIDTPDLRVVAPIEGDYNADGVVNAADYTVWRDGNGESPGYGAWVEKFDDRDDFAGIVGDYSGDGMVDAADYTVWRDSDRQASGYGAWERAYGKPDEVAPVGLPGSAVPEPAAAFSALALLAAVVARRSS